MLRALCVNDLSAVGRCSLAVMSPVLSALKVQCCPLPTAVLSTHTGGFDPIVRQDETQFVLRALAAYRQQELSFDCIVSGYFASAKAALAVADTMRTAAGTLRLCDPVMADGGRLYTGFDDEMVRALRDVCHAADVITPNLTESALLLGEDATLDALTGDELRERCLALAAAFDADVILTGAKLADGSRVCGGVRRKNQYFTLSCTYVRASYPGTGDLFCAVLAGALLAGNELESAAQLALHFTQKCVHTTFSKNTDPRFGVEFEPLLPELEAMICR